MTPRKRPGRVTIQQAARLIALLRARQAGQLESLTPAQIADRLDQDRSTVWRNLKKLDAIQKLADEYYALITTTDPPLK